MKHISFLAALAITWIAAGCGGTGNPYSDPGYDTYSTAYLPFVEGVSVPDDIYEDEPFEIVLKMSAVLAPDMLRGITPQTMYEWSFIPDPPPLTGVIVGAWCWRDINDIQGNELISELHWPFNGWPAGTYTIQVVSAESRAWGGISDEFMLTPTFGTPHSEHQVTQEYSLTVLPQP